MKKIIFLTGLVFVIASILLAVFLVQNQIKEEKPLFGLSPEKTAVLHVQRMTQAGFQIEANTVEAIQKVMINDMILILVQYNARQIEGGVELCEMVVEVEKSLLNQWNAKSGAGLCHKIDQHSSEVPITIVSNYGTSTLLDRGYSTAFGYLRDNQITEVIITWEDGVMQSASISARTYLCAREGGFFVEKIEAYNSHGVIVYSSQITPP